MKSFWLALGSAALIANAPAFAQTSSATHPQVLLKTTDGDIKVELYPEQAPKTVANFLDYVKSGQYSGTVFHRVIKGFMIQGGGYTASFAEKPTRAPIPLESRNGAEEHGGHDRHGAHGRSEFGHRPILHQYGRQRRARLSESGRERVRGIRQGRLQAWTL